MKNELVIIYDTPSFNYERILSSHNLNHYLKFFDRVRVLYWAKKEDGSRAFSKGRIIFYPYCQSYNSGYFTGLRYMAWIFKTLWKICKESPKAVLMTVIPIWPGIPTLMVAKLKKRKAVLRLEAQKTEHLKEEEREANNFWLFTKIKTGILMAIYFLTVPFFDCVIGISRDVVQEARYYRARKTVLIPIPVKAEIFKESRQKKNKKPVLLSVGQIKKIKGFSETIKAIKLLKKDVKLVIVGEATNPKDENFFKDLQEEAKGLDVEFRGKIEHRFLPLIYNEADIFVHSSYTEALGIVIMEAMLSGLPVVASNTSGARDLVIDKTTGFLTPVKDPVSLKEKIEKLVEAPGLRESMGKAGQKRVKKIIEAIDEKDRKLWKEMIS